MPNRITLTVRDNSFTDNYFTTERVDSVSAYNYSYRSNIEDTLNDLINEKIHKALDEEIAKKIKEYIDELIKKRKFVKNE